MMWKSLAPPPRYHPWNDKHRKVLKAHGVAPPAPDPFYEEIKAWGVHRDSKFGSRETVRDFRMT